MEKKTFFTTLDINLGAWLSLHGINPILENRNGKVVFLFESSDRLYKLISDFNSNQLVPVCDFVTKQKILRGRLIQLRNA